ncbi:DUF4124 domain-containing protein [Steroidobacter agaridevorans]|uniref:DUF4124 domain-containing protein n=1 Tax=Steroidobacter agaridevorans TaxID=2695856 RepID=UPI00137A1E33|nr:DUF4124 domain-containing protein [Steroidobacter agaridevorans]
MLRSVLLLTLAAASLAAGAAHADVYKYKDEKGNIQYTDKPPSLPAERLNVQSQRTDIVAAQERSQAAIKANTSAPPAAGNSPAEQKAAAAASAQDKADRCIKARERYDQYMNSQRLYEEGKDGERRYLTDAELDAARASAKASMDVLCQ